jgi:hypothetical protein
MSYRKCGAREPPLITVPDIPFALLELQGTRKRRYRARKQRPGDTPETRGFRSNLVR